MWQIRAPQKFGSSRGGVRNRQVRERLVITGLKLFPPGRVGAGARMKRIYTAGATAYFP
jgi:hypothetical protein